MEREQFPVFYEIKTHKLKEIKIRIFRKKKKEKRREVALFKIKMDINLVPKWIFE